MKNKKNGQISIKKNIWYQSLYSIIVTITPLITAPYLARTLGAESQGIYSYTNSIVNYFVLFAMLGIANHGVRKIAQSKDNPNKLNNNISTIYCIQFISTSIMLLLYTGYLLLFNPENLVISTIQIIAIISCYFDITWLYQGLESFKTIVIRNIIIKTLVVTSILLFVNSPNDLWAYTLIMTGGTLISNAILSYRLKRHINIKKINLEKIRKELKPILILFIPILALSIYHIMDKTMLGMLSTYENVGYYYNADKVINIPIGIISGISLVLFPRSVVMLKKSKDHFIKLFNLGLESIILTSIALSFGIAAIAKEFTPIFFGDGFDPCVQLIITLSPVMIIKSVATIIRYQYLIPLKKEKIFIKSVCCGALTNLILNILLIPHYGALGAVIGTLLAELSACLVQIILVRRELQIGKVFINCLAYIIFGIIMIAAIRLVANNLDINPLIKLISEIVIGGGTYVLLVLLYGKIAKKEYLKLIRRK